MRRDRRPVFTRRAVVFAVVVVSLALSLVYPAQRYVEQRRRTADLAAQVAAGRANLAALRADLDRWNDPTFIERQARRRLHYARPGDTALRVQPPGSIPEPLPRAPGSPDGGAGPAAGPWWGRLIGSVAEAAQETRPARR